MSKVSNTNSSFRNCVCNSWAVVCQLGVEDITIDMRFGGTSFIKGYHTRHIYTKLSFKINFKFYCFLAF